MLDEGQTSLTPDIILNDNVEMQTPDIIEITHGDGVKKDLKKVRELIDADDYVIVEGFVYDYKRNEWHKYHRDKGDITD
jgi:molybdopterin-guanine dinucleotide biosynthesis protein